MRRVLLACLTFGFLLVASASAHAKPRSIAELVEVIDGPKKKYDFVDKIDALHEIAEHNNLRAVEELVRRLDTSRIAASVLTEMHVAGSERLLIKALSSNDEDIRAAICIALGRLGSDRAVQALADRVVNDSDKWVRRNALHSLRNDAQKRPAGPAVRALVDALQSSELEDTAKRVLWTVHDVRAASLIRPGLENPSKEVRAFSCDWLRSRKDAASTDALIALLAKEKDRDVRAKAMLTLAIVHPNSRSKEVAMLLTKGLGDADPSRALSALNRTLKHREGVFPPAVAGRIASSLHRLFSHSDDEIARSAVLAAKQLGHASTAAKAIPLLDSSSRYMRQAAIAAVGNSMTNSREAKALLKAIENEDGQNSALSTFAREIRVRKGVAKLVLAGLSSRSKHVRRATAKLLGRQGDSAAAFALIRALQKEPDRNTAEAMGIALQTCATPAVLRSMTPLLAQKRGNREAAKAFVRVDRKQRFKEAAGVISKGGKAAEALLNASKGLAGDEVLYQWAASSKEKLLRGIAAKKLKTMTSLTSVGLLCKLLQDRDSYTAQRAASSLGESHRAGAGRCLVGALGSSKHKSVQDEVIYRALQRLSGEKYGDDARAWKSWAKGNMGLGRGVPGLAIALQSGVRERVALAAYAAERLPAKQVRRLLPALLGALEKEHQTQVRVALMCAIAVAKARSTSTILHKDLERQRDPDELIARARALLAIGDDSGKQLLIERVADQKYRDRDAIEAALWKLK